MGLIGDEILAGVKLGGTGLDPTSGDKVEMLDD